MALVLTEEQEILQRTARELVTGRSSFKRLRELRDGHDAVGFSRELWGEMARLGWLGIVIPEAYGGTGLGYTDLMVVMEEMGRGLLPEPMLSTVLLGAGALLLGGSEAQKAEHLPAIVAGERLFTLAFQESRSRYDLEHVETRAERAGSGWRLSGQKIHVLDGHVADWLVIAARTAGAPGDAAGITLFLLPRDASGIGIERQWRLDGRGAALVRLDGVRAGADAVVGGVDVGGTLLRRVVDRATIALTAEMLGGMCAAYEMTLAYLKTRVQFGQLIGTFQALKHRAVRLFIETELARSIVMAAHRLLDEQADDARVARLATTAKARCSDAFMLVAHEGVQMHGGIGMTDEHDIGLFLKRARGAEITFGDAAQQRARAATVEGY
jgi:alkylation response protein AidB-like acyl-CoA dehydrogenase